jgi:hypothetical protein
MLTPFNDVSFWRGLDSGAFLDLISRAARRAGRIIMIFYKLIF